MNIVVKSVKCGDCSILYGKSERLLIDCGSDNSNGYSSSSEFSFSAIQKEIKNEEITDILISHFHKDHFNGILEIPDTYCLNTAYLPYSIVDGKIIYTQGIGRLLSVAPSRSWGFRLSKNILNLFMKLEKISSAIRFVKKDDIIQFDGDEIRVLWPEIATTGFKYDDLPVKQILADSQFSSYYFPEESTDSLANTERKLERQFTEILGEDNQNLIEAMGNFSKQFENYIRNLHENNKENRREDFTPVYEAYLNLNRQREIFRSKLNDVQLEDIKIFSRQQYHYLVTSMNSISIVCDCRTRFLFLGDVPVNVINYIRSSLENKYEFVKIQHHGTERYFTSDTPCGSYNLISNGGYEKRKVSEQFIGREKVICTNAHDDPQRFCVFYANNAVCSPKCIQVNMSYLVNI